MLGNQSTQSASSSEMPYRVLGKTGENVSCIGLGGFHLGQSHLEEPDAIQLFQSAVDRGMNFSDNSWDYNQGESERRVGKALKGYREKVFVMTKFDGRTKQAALKQLDQSLERLQVDHVDLWQFHENIRLEDPDRFFADGGAHEAMTEAKQSGKVRYFGFTGQGSQRAPADVGTRRQTQLPFRYRADALKRDGRAFPQLWQGSCACFGQEADRDSGDEIDGQRLYFAKQNSNADRVLALRS